MYPGILHDSIPPLWPIAKRVGINQAMSNLLTVRGWGVPIAPGAFGRMSF